MFEFRLRILDVRERVTDPPSFLGIVDGFPRVMAHAGSLDQTERDLEGALREHLKRLMNHEATLVELDDYTTTRTVRLVLAGTPT